MLRAQAGAFHVAPAAATDQLPTLRQIAQEVPCGLLVWQIQPNSCARPTSHHCEAVANEATSHCCVGPTQFGEPFLNEACPQLQPPRPAVCQRPHTTAVTCGPGDARQAVVDHSYAPAATQAEAHEVDPSTAPAPLPGQQRSQEAAILELGQRSQSSQEPAVAQSPLLDVLRTWLPSEELPVLVWSQLVPVMVPKFGWAQPRTATGKRPLASGAKSASSKSRPVLS
mmetsp:Transcript_4281/g.9996  ORF Transcript_4281/g.9996 Transcript_4281/m.9996 type:complete len:226 (+) Transcript_4281:405-1082(+)